MGNALIIMGVILILVGLAWHLGLGRLPGDIVVERENFKFYFPLASSLIVSAILSLIFWWLRR